MHVCAEMWTVVHTTVQKSVEHSAPTYVLVYREVHTHVHSTFEFILMYKKGIEVSTSNQLSLHRCTEVITLVLASCTHKNTKSAQKCTKGCTTMLKVRNCEH